MFLHYILNTMVSKNDFGFYSLVDKPSEKELQEYYANKYYQDASDGYEKEYSKEELEYFDNKISERFYIISNYFSFKNDQQHLLDIGCGEGWVLKYFRKKGWEVTGLDYSTYACARFNPECLPYLVDGDIYLNLSLLAQQNRKFDVVWLDNVLEHVLEPFKLIKDICNIISPGGLLVVEVPNDFSLLQNFLVAEGHVDRKFWIAIPDHISYFTRQGLENLLAAGGWAPVKIISDYPIDWNLLNTNTNYVMDKAKGKSCHKERVTFENFIHQQPMDKVIHLYEAMANIGLGRQIVGIFKLV